MARSLRWYLVAVCGLYVFGLVTVIAWDGGLAGVDVGLVAPLLGVSIAIEALAVHRARNQALSMSFSASAYLASAVLFGPLVAALVASLTVVVVDGLRRSRPVTIAMNASMFGLAVAAGAWAFEVAGGQFGSPTVRDAVPLVVLLAVRFLVNEAILAGAVSLQNAARYASTLRDAVVDDLVAGIGEGCLGVTVAFGYAAGRWVVLPFLVPLLWIMYKANANFAQLRDETADALNALAGVIDERDRSTSQHSERVAAYVADFVAAIGLADREARRLVEAARFHDLGKVAVDVATLTKAGRLSDEEVRSIRSHARLSARLLAPFHFARDIALYAELHHERYDGKGYYSVAGSEIPVEAHVLIVADSFDAMTSARAYRPALTMEEALTELRDKAGTQFHPRIAIAFAAMIEGKAHPADAGNQRGSTLADEFAKVATFDLSWVHGLANASTVSASLAALSLVGLAPTIPRIVPAMLGGAAAAAAAWSLAMHVLERRRLLLFQSAIDAGMPLSEALALVGIVGWGAWLYWDENSAEYVAHCATASAEDLEEIRLRALRPGESALTGRLSSGNFVTLSPAALGAPRIAVGAERRLSAAQRRLIARVRPADAVTTGVEARPGERKQPRTPVDANAGGLMVVVDLGVFEDVRLTAGQLSAERVVGAVARRLQSVLRPDDQLVQLDEDRFGVALSMLSEPHLDGLRERLRRAAAEVPVPHGAAPIDPVVRTVDVSTAPLDPDVICVTSHLHTAHERRTAA